MWSREWHVVGSHAQTGVPHYKVEAHGACSLPIRALTTNGQLTRPLAYVFPVPSFRPPTAYKDCAHSLNKRDLIRILSCPHSLCLLPRLLSITTPLPGPHPREGPRVGSFGAQRGGLARRLQ